jgi:hypothetical protein
MKTELDCLNNNKPYGWNWEDFLLPDQMEFLFKAMEEYRNQSVHTPPVTDKPFTNRAVKKCAEWLSYCLSIGWEKSHIDELEALWYKYHDENGNLINL